MTVKVTVAKCELCGLLLGANYILFNAIIIIRHKPKLYQYRITEYTCTAVICMATS